MAKQWHPLFAHLLGLLLKEYYEIETEVPVSELPRRGDIFLVRRQGSAEPPFRGVWEHLTPWNVLEFKGPGDDAEEQDLELLIHVGSGLTYRLNEERRTRGESVLANREVSFWYLAPTLGDTFLDHARTRAALDYQTGGLWRSRVWGHPVWFLSYQDAPVEVDTIPLHLLAREQPAPRALGELVVQRQDLLRLFAAWVSALQPGLWKEIRAMATASSDGPRLDWQAISEIADLGEAVRFLPPERVVQLLGIERAIRTIGLDRIIASVGLPQVIAEIGRDKLLGELLPGVSEQERQELLRREPKKGETPG